MFLRRPSFAVMLTVSLTSQAQGISLLDHAYA
jgi:hypothetical protein